MNEFKQQVLSAIDNHTGFTTNDYLDDMRLDQSDKPKLSRVLSELKKDGYVSSVMGEDKLLCWSLTPQGAAYVAENRKGLKLDMIPQPQCNPDDVAFKVNDKSFNESDYAVIGYKHSGDDRTFGTLDECLDDARVWVNSEMESVDISQVMVKPIAKYDYVPAKVELNWID
jgi:DNA-binding MarR family transcriptional regulator